MYAPEITIGGSPVYSSGTIITADDLPVRFALFPPPNPYFLEIRFIQDANGSRVENLNEGFGHVVRLYNLSSSGLPVSNVAPIYVANNNGRQLHLRFAVLSISASPNIRSIAYTIFDGGPTP